MRIIHWLSVTHLLQASQFPPLHRECKKQRRNLIHSHEKNTASLCRQKSFCTPDLQPKFKFHQKYANGTRRLEFGFKTTGRNVMSEEESISPAWKQLWMCPMHIIGHILNWLNLYQLRNVSEVSSILRVTAEVVSVPSLPSLSPFSIHLMKQLATLCTCVYYDNQVQQQQQVNIFTLGKGERNKFWLWYPTFGQDPAWLTKCEYWYTSWSCLFSHALPWLLNQSSMGELWVGESSWLIAHR